MPTPVIPKPVLICTVSVGMPEGVANSKLYFKTSTPLTNYEDVLAVTNGVQTSFYASLAAVLSVDCQLLPMNGRYQTATDDFEVTATAVIPECARDPGVMPIQDCFEIRRLTGKAGRNERGRVFFSGLSESNVSDGQVDPAMLPQMQALSHHFVVDTVVGAIDCIPVLWDRKQNALSNIQNAYCVSRLVSRRDRAKREKYVPLSA